MAMPYMPFFWGDYWRDTAHLSDAEHVSYLRLISHYWQHGGLPKDDDRLSRIAGRNLKDWRKMRETICSFFSPDWKHPKIERLLQKQLEAREVASARAKAAANARWAKTSLEQCLEHSLGHCLGDANQNHNQIKVNNRYDTARSSSAFGASSLARNASEIEPELKAKISADFDALSESLRKANETGSALVMGENTGRKKRGL